MVVLIIAAADDATSALFCFKNLLWNRLLSFTWKHHNNNPLTKSQFYYQLVIAVINVDRQQ